MENANSPTDAFNKPIDWQDYYSKCADIKSDLAFYTDDIRFLQQLLDKYFQEMAKTENLDEIREILMRFQDLCFIHGQLKKRLKDQQHNLVGIIKGAPEVSPDKLISEQSIIKKQFVLFEVGFKTVKKEMLTMADDVLEVRKENDHSHHHRRF